MAESGAGFPLGARPGPPILRSTWAPGGSDQGDAESFRIERGWRCGILPRGLGSRRSAPGRCEISHHARPEHRPLARIGNRDGRITVMQNPSAPSTAKPPGSARAQLAPLPQGVGSLLGRAGEARSGFCREVKRRDARSSINPSHRRLTSRQVPDCLRGPTEERTHPRHLTITNPSPSPTPAPTQTRHSLRGKGLPAATFDLETAARPANATGGRAPMSSVKSGLLAVTGMWVGVARVMWWRCGACRAWRCGAWRGGR